MKTRPARSTWLAGLGGVAAAFLGALCCAGPLIFVTFGVGAGLASTFEPLRPVFGVLMLGAFAIGFYTIYGKRPAPEPVGRDARSPGEACALPRNQRREKVLLWSAAVIALVLWTFPTWSILLI